MLPKNKYPRYGKFTEDKSGNNSEVTKSKVTVITILSKPNTLYQLLNMSITCSSFNIASRC